MRGAILAAILGCVAAPALAQDAANGKLLYKTYCQVCHTVDPSTSVAPFNQIMTAADDPAQILVAAQVEPSQMGWIPDTFTSQQLADIAAYLGTYAATPTATVVEFYNAAQDHYFISASAQEIADLDNGVHAGWMRTGLSFKAYVQASATASPVCRFYLPPMYGDSHFYSASPAECAQVAARYPGFVYETPSAFYIGLPDATTGACPAATIPVYRVFDDRADTNHRYTTSLAIREQMQAQGWIAEGYGPSQTIMCSPQ